MNYALITGASKGIGKALALQLAARKIPLLLIARSESLLKDVSTQIKKEYAVEVHYLNIDLSQTNAAQDIFDWCLQNTFNVNILINNAGYGLSGALEKYTLQEHLFNMQVNMQTPTALIYLFLPILKKQRSYILNVCSSAAYQSVPGLNLYAATKAFLLSFSRGLSYELKDSSVSVTAICPGATDTDFATTANVNGIRARKLADKVNMTPEAVAKVGLEGMFSGKKEVVPGFINKLGKFLVWLIPAGIAEKSAAGIYDL